MLPEYSGKDFVQLILTLFGERNAKGFAYYLAICGALLLFITVLERIGSLAVKITQAVGETAQYADALVNYAIAFGIFAFVIFLFVLGTYLIGRTDRRAQRQLEQEREKHQEEHRSEMAAIMEQLNSIQQVVGTQSDESETDDGEVHTDD